MKIGLQIDAGVGSAGVGVIARSAASEAMRVLDEGVASMQEICCIMHEAAGFPLTPSGLSAEDNAAAGPSVRCRTHPAVLPERVWVSQAIPEWAEQVRRLVANAGVPVDNGQRPAEDALIVVTPLGQDATTLCSTQGLDPLRTVAVDCLFGLHRHRTIMATPLTSGTALASAEGLFSADGTSLSLIRDSSGMVAQRIVAVLVNAACDLAQRAGVRVVDIDRAARFELGYSQGPLALGDAIGPRRVMSILEAMQEITGDPRYRPSPWLKRRVLLDISLIEGR